MNKGILVIGDIMLDKYIYGNSDRLSPEAPIPVVDCLKEENSLGGAANVANNIQKLGVESYLIGLIGNDINAKVLEKILHGNKIKTFNITSKDIITTTKTRILGNNQQICRIDNESKNIKFLNLESDIEDIFLKVLPNIKMIILSDYDKGFLSKGIVSKICSHAVKNKIDVLVDPKFLDWNKYNGATYITPNFKEFSYAVNKQIKNNDADIEKYGRELLKRYDIENIIVTRAEKGISLINNSNIIHAPTSNKKVYDVTGAGDTVIATIAFCLFEKVNLKESLHWANKAASVVIRKIGANPITYDDLKEAGYSK
tara:strand:- start:85 stop:1023 length:939 start_codon:yes stop_codon:yes gene_type:complete